MNLKLENPENDDTESIIILSEEQGERLDKVLFNRFKGLHSRTYFQYLIEQERILVNGDSVKKRYLPKEGDEVFIHYILSPEINLEPENIPLNIVYEDSDLIVINKPAGMVVHPAPGHPKNTFVNALLYHCKNLSKEANDLRPGIVHRLDKDTSGLLIAAKTSEAHRKLIEMFSSREIYKEYLAICLGNPGDREIRTLIGRHPVIRQKMKVLEEGGRSAVSHCKTLLLKDNLSLVKVELETGRTHQIRVHMQFLNTPVLGDPIYGNSQINAKHHVDRQLLHAYILRFKHPITDQLLELKAECPADMQAWINKLS
jgi:23S rRNA pseudouridine1911/1915/1917 synthase